MLALCKGFPSQRPVTQSFDVFFDLRQNKRLSKTNSRVAVDLRHHRAHNDLIIMITDQDLISIVTHITSSLIGSDLIQLCSFSFVLQSRGRILCAIIPFSDRRIIIHFCTCHDSTAVVLCANFLAITKIEFGCKQGKLYFQRIWIAIEKYLWDEFLGPSLRTDINWGYGRQTQLQT